MEDINILIKQRLEKAEELKKDGHNLFKYNFDKKQSIDEIQNKYKDVKQKESGFAKTAGRIMIKRLHGKSGFADLKDESGEIQLYFRKDFVGDEKFSLFKKLDIGDIVGVEGTLFRTKTNELTIVVKKFDLLTKSFRPLPEKFHGLQDKEIRYRQRYVDLIVNDDVKETFKTRSKILSNIRKYMEENNYIEVETPVLQDIYGGANATPFITKHKTLDKDFYLRISLETYLKRLIVGGFEKVFEIGKVFRNEGIDRQHNPEFTLMEYYAAYNDLFDMMNYTEGMIKYLVKTIGFDSGIIEYDEREIDLSGDWERLSMKKAIEKYADIKIDDKENDKLKNIILREDEKAELDNSSRGELIYRIFELLVEDNLINPTFIIDFPIEVSPLAKKKRDAQKGDFVERFELFMNGWEIANAFSELNDPHDQRERFQKQEKKFVEGNEEAQRMDEDFIRSLEYGMPPTGGVGIGIDRLVMLFTNSKSIKDVIFFPHLKDK
ncbi:MAG: lysine--tRNA ligase [Candidatus Mcinerneyibacterium aminivorans]|uniref:Lysine--tRNA ligase n=1 Tax=Candidatus Mcinerneyibacterium aminivorans TaxID=2703815 RepID=A0A5D0MMQ4_9BACT|nr:MAG: lysine--tRNA ligase [Candidatus Mcinerneyibacterium aminivorans]